MKAKSCSSHFQGKEALEHLIDARIKGQCASSEVHGAELPGHISAFADAAKETSLLFFVLWTIFTAIHLEPNIVHWILVIFSIGWLVWKTGRSAILGWARLERMHRVIEEERYEIEHHRPQEKEELKALYQAKGFSGRLLDEAVDILMADDNRLLQVMLQEELGFKLESQEHPLKQASGAFLGVILSSLIMALALFAFPPSGVGISAALVIGLSAGVCAHLERNRLIPAIVWNLASAALAAIASDFAVQLIFKS
jgi:hypothetical protein